MFGRKEGGKIVVVVVACGGKEMRTDPKVAARRGHMQGQHVPPPSPMEKHHPHYTPRPPPPLLTLELKWCWMW